MADQSELEGLDPFDLLDAESARVERHFLGSPDWDRPSRCQGWTTRDMLSHLAGVEDYNRACLDDDLPSLFARAAENKATDLDSFNSWLVELYGALPAEVVIEQWRAANAAFRAEMRARGRDGSMTTSVGAYPVWLQAFHLAMEYATHADDIGAVVDDAERQDRTAWRARFARFAVAEQEKLVMIEGAGGRNRVRAGSDEVELDDDDLIEASQGRLSPDHPLSPALREALNTVS
jgi:uncharacterized protein (TIGR03083 family)